MKDSIFMKVGVTVNETQFQKELGSNIKMFRKLMHLTQRELALKINKSMACVSKYENGEIAIDAFQRAGTLDKEAVRDALAATDLQTIVGPIKYDKEMMGLTYGDTVLADAHWQMQDDGTEKLVVIDNTVYSNIDIPITGEYKAGNALNK